MGVKRRRDLAKQYEFKSWREITPMQVSLGTMLHNKTGNWRSIKPVFEDKTPACQNACPAGNDIEGWLKLLEKNEYEKAYWHLKQEEPFPAILGRVCFKYCESDCSRAVQDHCLSIRDLERFIGEKVLPSTRHPQIPPDNGKSLAVVGSGPAGMSVAYFARLLGFKVVMFEKHPVPGGILRVGIPEYRLPSRIVEAEFEGLAHMGVELKTVTEIGKDLSFEAIASSFDYIFFGIGAHRSLTPGWKGIEQHFQVRSGLDLLKKIALGEEFDLGPRVIVIGGGNTAIDAARSAVRLGRSVTILYRRTEAEMPAHPEEIQAAREEGVVLRFTAEPDRIILDERGAVKSLRCCETVPGEPDEKGRLRFHRQEGSTFSMEADSILTAIGETPDFANLSGFIHPSAHFIPVDDGLCVPLSGKITAKVYAGGDLIDIPRTVVHAVASGKRAAIAMDCDRKGTALAEVLKSITIGQGPAISFSKYRGWPNVNPVPRNDQAVVDSEKIVYDYFKKMPKIAKERPPGHQRILSFDPYEPALTEEEVRQEGARCLHCGRCTECGGCLIFCPDVSVVDQTQETFGFFIDYDYCKGCGICVTECPRQAISMVKEATPIIEED